MMRTSETARRAKMLTDDRRPHGSPASSPRSDPGNPQARQRRPVTVEILRGYEQDLPPADANVVIDVIRAFTTAHVAFARGAQTILLVNDLQKAFELKNRSAEYLLVGEIDGLRIPGFDFGNSPAEISQANLAGRTLVLKTTNGVEAALRALQAPLVLVAALVNARKTSFYLRRKIEEGVLRRINLIASHPSGDEDLACAQYVRSLLIDGAPVTASHVAWRVRQSKAAEKFLDASRPEFDPRDVDFCAQEDEDALVLQARRDGLPRLVRIE
jgi:2-phosphosulfolactate phosphatase